MIRMWWFFVSLFVSLHFCWLLIFLFVLKLLFSTGSSSGTWTTNWAQFSLVLQGLYGFTEPDVGGLGCDQVFDLGSSPVNELLMERT